jgi:hypothetical protein
MDEVDAGRARATPASTRHDDGREREREREKRERDVLLTGGEKEGLFISD